MTRRVKQGESLGRGERTLIKNYFAHAAVFGFSNVNCDSRHSIRLLRRGQPCRAGRGLHHCIRCRRSRTPHRRPIPIEQDLGRRRSLRPGLNGSGFHALRLNEYVNSSYIYKEPPPLSYDPTTFSQMKAASSPPSSSSNKAMPHNPPCKHLNDLLNPDSFKFSQRINSTATSNDPHQLSTNAAMSLHSEDFLTLVEILDQVSGSNRVASTSFDAPRRPSRLQTWCSTSEERVSASSRGYVARSPSYHVLSYSQTTYQGRATSHSLLEGPRMFGKAAIMGSMCAS